jgi:hypothetical protein
MLRRDHHHSRFPVCTERCFRRREEVVKHLDSQPRDLQPCPQRLDRCDIRSVGRATGGEGVPRGEADLFHSQFHRSVQSASEVNSRRARVAD